MKNVAFIFYTGWLFLTINGTAVGGSPITYSEPITFTGCEFRVFFPTKTRQKSVFVDGMTSLAIQSVYDGESPFMRAECLPLSNPIETISAFRTILENYAKNSRLQRPEITIEKSKLGHIGTFAGVRNAGGFDIKIFGKLVIGNTSMLALLIPCLPL